MRSTLLGVILNVSEISRVVQLAQSTGLNPSIRLNSQYHSAVWDLIGCRALDFVGLTGGISKEQSVWPLYLRKVAFAAVTTLRGCGKLKLTCINPLIGHRLRFHTPKARDRQMPLPVICTNCTVQFLVRDELEGKRIVCPHCEVPFTIPAHEPVFDVLIPSLENAVTAWPSVGQSTSLQKTRQASTQSAPVLESDSTVSKAPPHYPIAILAAACAGTSMLTLIALGSAFWWLQVGKLKSQANAETPSVVDARQVPPITAPPTTVPVVSSSQNDSSNTVTPPSHSPESIAESNLTTEQGDSSKPRPRSTPQTHETASPDSSSPPSLPPLPRTIADSLEGLKRGTVFLKASIGTDSVSGSGWLLQKKGNEGLVVTNAHVVGNDTVAAKNIVCVFQSGQRSEFSVEASIVGIDKPNDLAILRVSHDDLPTPIEITNEPRSFQETTRVFALGFPFGNALSLNKKNPSLSISNAWISSIRRDDNDQPVLFQIDGGINKGNSGGPIVDETGQLIGIAVAKVSGADNIGFAIPLHFVVAALRGTVVRAECKEVVVDGTGLNYTLNIELLDPNSNIESVKLIAFRKEAQIHKTVGENGTWEQAANMLRFQKEFDIAKRKGKAEVKVEGGVDMCFQVHVHRKDGTDWYSAPQILAQGSKDDLKQAAESGGMTPRSTEKKPKMLDSSVRVTKLPTSFLKVALNRRNSDLAGLSVSTNQLVVLPGPEYADKADQAVKVDVGRKPSSVIYKTFGGSEFYIVACSQDNHIYVIDAKERTLKKRILIEGKGAAKLTASENEADPFVYYSMFPLASSRVGAIDLREMTDCKVVLENCLRCTISNDGSTAYCILNGTITARSLISGFNATPPTFVQLPGQESVSTDSVILDPYGEFFFVGNSMFSSRLNKRVGTLPCIPLCFAQDSPVVIGFNNGSLVSGSSNSFQFTSATVPLVVDEKNRGEREMKQLNETGNFAKYDLHLQVFADERNDRVLATVPGIMMEIPMEQCGIRGEPMLHAQVGSTHFQVGQPNTLTLKPLDPQVRVDFENIPKGATLDGNALEWTPNEENIGTETVGVKLSNEEFSRSIELKLNVSRPFIKAPFAITDFIVNEDKESIIAWSNRYTDVKTRSFLPNDQRLTEPGRLAIIPMKQGEETHLLNAQGPVSNLLVSGSRLIVFTKVGKVDGLELFDLESRKQIKSHVPSSPILETISTGNDLVLIEEKFVETFDAETLTRKSQMPLSSQRHAIAFSGNQFRKFRDGILSNGLLVDSIEGVPLLLFNPPQGLMSVSTTDPRWSEEDLFRAPVNPVKISDERLGNLLNDQTNFAGPFPIPQTPWLGFLDGPIKKSQPGRVPPISLRFTNRTLDTVHRVQVVESQMEESYIDFALPSMRVSNDQIYVSHLNYVYRWGMDFGNRIKRENVESLYVAPSQSQFVIRGDSTLKNKALGGTPPFRWTGVMLPNGVTVDESSGDVQIKLSDLVFEMEFLLKRNTLGRNNTEERIRELGRLAEPQVVSIKERLGQTIKGFPIALAIRLNVTDARNESADMQYHVIIDVPYPAVKKLLEFGQ